MRLRYLPAAQLQATSSRLLSGSLAVSQAPLVAFEDTQTDLVDDNKVYTTGVTVMEYNANDDEW